VDSEVAWSPEPSGNRFSTGFLRPWGALGFSGVVVRARRHGRNPMGAGPVTSLTGPTASHTSFRSLSTARAGVRTEAVRWLGVEESAEPISNCARRPASRRRFATSDQAGVAGVARANLFDTAAKLVARGLDVEFQRDPGVEAGAPQPAGAGRRRMARGRCRKTLVTADAASLAGYA